LLIMMMSFVESSSRLVRRVSHLHETDVIVSDRSF
jgi:hypothetical protein